MLFGWFGTVDILIILFILVLFVGLIAGVVVAVYLGIKKLDKLRGELKIAFVDSVPRLRQSDLNSRADLSALRETDGDFRCWSS